MIARRRHATHISKHTLNGSVLFSATNISISEEGGREITPFFLLGLSSYVQRKPKGDRAEPTLCLPAPAFI